MVDIDKECTLGTTAGTRKIIRTYDERGLQGQSLTVCSVDRKILEPETRQITDRTKILAFIVERCRESLCIGPAT